MLIRSLKIWLYPCSLGPLHCLKAWWCRQWYLIQEANGSGEHGKQNQTCPCSHPCLAVFFGLLPNWLSCVRIILTLGNICTMTRLRWALWGSLLQNHRTRGWPLVRTYYVVGVESSFPWCRVPTKEKLYCHWYFFSFAPILLQLLLVATLVVTLLFCFPLPPWIRTTKKNGTL